MSAMLRITDLAWTSLEVRKVRDGDIAVELTKEAANWGGLEKRYAFTLRSKFQKLIC
jgi:hypothetical protein